MGYLFPDFRGDAVALIAHDDETVSAQRLLVDVLTIEKGAIDRCAFGKTVYQGSQIGIDDVHSGDAAHRGLYDLRIIHVGGSL